MVNFKELHILFDINVQKAKMETVSNLFLFCLTRGH